MKISRIIILLFVMIGFTACTTVKGPVHLYSGQPRPASETAHLHVPAAITVKEIDGKEVKVPSILEGFYDIYLLPGKHRIDFKYELYWGNNEDGMFVKSDVVGVIMLFKAGMNYEFNYPIPNGEEDAYEKTRKFKATVLEKETGRQVVSQSLDELKRFKANVAAQYNSQPVMTQNVNTNPNTAAAGVAVPSGITADTAVHEDAVKRLKFWWLTASPAERKQFKAWMKSVEAIK